MTDWLIDKSALVRLGATPDDRLWLDRIDKGLVRISTPTLLEAGFSARNASHWTAVVDGAPIAWMPLEYVTPQAERRAVEVQRLLAERGQHRAPSIPDLLIAAIAEVGALTVLHVDKDFDLIADITQQPMERLRTNPAPHSGVK